MIARTSFALCLLALSSLLPAAPTTQPDMKLTIQGRRSRPTVYIDRDDIARAKKNAQTPWGKPIAEKLVKQADAWASKSDEQIIALVPQAGACFAYHFSGCPICGATNSWWGASGCTLDDPGHITCPNGHRMPDADHPDPGTGWRDKNGKIFYFVGAYNSYVSEQLLKACNDLANAYALTGEARYARKGALLLDHLARVYPLCDKGSWDYPSDPPSGRFNRPWYQVARTLIQYTHAYDVLASTDTLDAPSSVEGLSRKQNIEKNLLLNGAGYCYGHARKGTALTNGQADYARGTMVVGVALGIPEYVHFAVHGPCSILSMIENNIDRDGQYYETSSLYSHHTRYLYMDMAEILHNYSDKEHPNGIHLIDNPKFKAFYTLPQSRVSVFGHLVTQGDDAPDLKHADDENSVVAADLAYLERLIALSPRREDTWTYGQLLLQAARNDLDQARLHEPENEKLYLLFHAEDLSTMKAPVSAAPTHPLTNSPVSSSDLLTQKGLAILRSDTTRSALTFRFGPTLNHGHYDEMGINLYALGRQLTYDLGYGLASTHTQVGWAKQTAAHNTVLVNEKSQLQSEGSGGSLELFIDLPGLKVVQADDTNAYTSEKLTRYARTCALVDAGPDATYFLDIFRVAGGTKHDYIFHGAGTDLKTSVPLSDPAKGSVAGAQYNHGNNIGPDGDLKDLPNKPYFNPPPGNGLGFLVNPRTSKILCNPRPEGGPQVPDAVVTATWNIDQKTHLRSHLIPGVCSQVVAAEAPGILPKEPRAAYLLARREADILSSTFAAIHEPFAKEPVIEKVELISDPITDSIAPLAIKVTLKNGRTDYLFHTTDQSPHTFRDGKHVFTLAGTFAKCSFDGKGLVDASMIQGTSLNVDGATMTLPQSEFAGQITAVNDTSLGISTAATLPQNQVLKNQFVRISNPAYSRATAYRIADVNAHLIRLATTTTQLARGHLDDPPLDAGRQQTLPNRIPFEYARSLNRKVGTGFFNGKEVVAEIQLPCSGTINSVHPDGRINVTPSSRFPAISQNIIINDCRPGDVYRISCFGRIARGKNEAEPAQANTSLKFQRDGQSIDFVPTTQP